METSKGKRVSGGTSFAYSMFRFNADSQSYVLGMLQRVVRKGNLDENEFNIYFSESDFLELRNNLIKRIF